VGVRASVLLVALLAAAAPSAAATHLLVVVGLGGDPENGARFHEWASTLVDAARNGAGLPRDSVIYLGEDVGRDPARIDGRSTREGITAAVERLGARARPGDSVLVVLIGHGASAEGAPRFNLPGRDLDARDWARLLERLAAQTVVFVNTASGSGAFLAPLAAPNRVVIAATRAEGERNQTRFGEFFVRALSSAEADRDKDGRVSLLEAFAWARQRTVAAYEQEGQILTEHAVLDDDGDGKGSDAPGDAASADGSLARTVFLAAGEASGPPPDADPALRALYDERRALEDRVARLKASRDRMAVAQYQEELEHLLLDLARKTREIREKEKQ
jgi:hypothetical protein